jgi:hypothetical protein
MPRYRSMSSRCRCVQDEYRMALHDEYRLDGFFSTLLADLERIYVAADTQTKGSECFSISA